MNQTFRKIIHRYTVEFEQDEESGNWGAFAVDLPIVAAGGDTFEEVEQKMDEGILLHIQGLKEDGLLVPEPSGEFRVIE
ncbi:MAG: type II toxin-antitoxin system HicB family antitoxin [Acidobacteria bacterium]|nr:type II toxin-antitoxin system HicB family antitoxin [Acidobacteriota bacterium]